MNLKFILSSIAIIAIIALGFSVLQQKNSVESAAEDAYVYGYPLVLMEATKNSGSFNVNRFTHLREFPDPTFNSVVRPNVDTLYSSTFLDLRKEPILLEVPDTQSRYYLVQMMDGWSEVFASVGTRTTGTKEENFAITGPNWKGVLPKDVKEIKAPTNLVWLISRLRMLPDDTLNDAHYIQDSFRITPISDLGKRQRHYSSNEKTVMKTPVDYVNNLGAIDFLTQLATLIQTNPPHKEDKKLVQSLAKLGIVPGKPFDKKFSVEQLSEIKKGFSEARENMIQGSKNLGALRNGWSLNIEGIGNYGTDYLKRASVALTGFGANAPEDAVYPMTYVDSDGALLEGSQKYRIHFDKETAPPSQAFWSLTAYDENDFLIENPINRYAIGSRDDPKANEDGSVDLFLQSEPTSEEFSNNWLPIPEEGPFSLVLRIYWPKRRVLTGEWSPPPVERIE